MECLTNDIYDAALKVINEVLSSRRCACLSICLSLCPFVRPSVCPSVCSSVCPSAAVTQSWVVWIFWSVCWAPFRSLLYSWMLWCFAKLLFWATVYHVKDEERIRPVWVICPGRGYSVLWQCLLVDRDGIQPGRSFVPLIPSGSVWKQTMKTIGKLGLPENGLSRVGFAGVMRPLFNFWFWRYIYCLLVYVVCFPSYPSLVTFSLLISSLTYLFLWE